MYPARHPEGWNGIANRVVLERSSRSIEEPSRATGGAANRASNFSLFQQPAVHGIQRTDQYVGA